MKRKTKAENATEQRRQLVEQAAGIIWDAWEDTRVGNLTPALWQAVDAAGLVAELEGLHGNGANTPHRPDFGLTEAVLKQAIKDLRNENPR